MKQSHKLLDILAAAIVVFAVLGYYLALNQTPIILFGLVGLIALTILLFIRPEYGLMALLVVRPMVDIIGTYTVNIADRYNFNLASALSLLAIVWSVWFLISHRAKIWNRELFWPIFFFASLSALSITFSLTPSATTSEILRIVSFCLLYFVTRELVSDLKAFYRLGLAFAASLAIPVVTGFYQVLTDSGLTFAESSNRAYGTFGHPNVLAFYLVLAISFLVMFMVQRSEKNASRWALIGVLGLLLILTFTRGAWGGLLLSFGLIALIRYRRLLIGGLFALVVIIAVLPGLNAITNSVFGFDMRTVPGPKEVIARQADQSSYQWRLDLWKDMRSRFYQKPLTGFGLGSFPALQQLTTNDMYSGVGAHNDYLRLLIELGLVGLISYIILLGGIFYYLDQTYRRLKNHPLSLPVLGIIGFSAAFAMMSVFDNLLQSTPVMWAYMILIGLVLNLKPVKVNLGKNNRPRLSR